MLRTLVMVTLATVTLAVSAAALSTVYIGQTACTPPCTSSKAAFRTAATGAIALLGTARNPGGPYDAMAAHTLVHGRNYTLVNESPFGLILTTTPGAVGAEVSGGPTAISSDTNIVLAHAFDGIANTTYDFNIQPGSSAVLRTTTLAAPSFVYYQALEYPNLGWLFSVLPCSAPAPPAQPRILAPANGATVAVGVVVSWAPVQSFGASCAALTAAAAGGPAETDAWKYHVLLEPGTGPLSPSLSIPAQSGSGIVPYTATSLALTQASIQPGTTYTWAVVASNGAATTVSASGTFTVAGTSTPAPTPPPAPANGVAAVHRVLPTVPPAAFAYAYFSIPITTPGGRLVVTASPTSLPVVSAPPAGSIQLVANGGNATSAAAVKQPTVANAAFKSAAPVTSARQVITIDVATDAQYFVGVGAPSGAATFSLAVTYECPTGAFLTSAEGTECTACPPGAVASSPAAASAAECVCGPGFYGPSGGPCTACPPGGSCPGFGGASARAGAFAFVADTGESVYYTCPLPSSCLGDASKPCRTGYTGELCSACASTHYALNLRCYECPSSPELNVVAGAVMLLLFLVATGELARFYRRFATVPVAINFVQIVAVLPIFQLEWPQYLVLFFNDCTGFNLNPELTAANCVMSMKWRTFWLFKLALPVLVAVLFFVMYLAARSAATFGCVCCAQGHKYLGLTTALKRRLLPAYITFLVFMYMSVTGAALAFFDCTRQPDGGYTLDADASIKCYDSEWQSLLGFAIFGVFAYAVGIPLVLLVWLINSGDALYAISPSGDAHYAYLGPIYLRYRPEVYWWELVHFGRKAAVLAWGYFFTTFTLLQAIGTLASLVLFLVAHLAVSPYEYSPANTFDAFLQAVVIILLAAGLLFQSGELAAFDHVDDLVFAVLAVIFSLALLVGIWTTFREFYQVHNPVSREQLDAIDERITHAESLHFAYVQRAATGGGDSGDSSYYSDY